MADGPVIPHAASPRHTHSTSAARPRASAAPGAGAASSTVAAAAVGEAEAFDSRPPGAAARRGRLAFGAIAHHYAPVPSTMDGAALLAPSASRGSTRINIGSGSRSLDTLPLAPEQRSSFSRPVPRSFSSLSPLGYVAEEPTSDVLTQLPLPATGLAPGSLWGTSFNMCAAVLGAGVLSLPHAIGAMGLIPGLSFLMLAAIATHYSVVLLVASILATNTRSFEDLARAVFGEWNGRAVELSIICFQYGCLVAYTIAIGDILQPVLELPSFAHAFPWLTKDATICIFWLFLCLPLSCVRDISSLQFTSLFGVMALGYLVLAVAIHFGFDAAADWRDTVGEANWVNHASLTDAVSAMGILMFAFSCQVNVPALYDELSVRTPAQMARVSRRACTICMLFYAVAGFAGYTNFPHSHAGNLLRNYCLLDASKSTYAKGSSHALGPLVLLAFLAIAVTVTFAWPVNVYPTRYTLDVMLFQQRLGEKHKTARHVGLTLVVAVPCLLVALSGVNLSDVFSLIGGTTSAYVCYSFPAAVAWRLGDRIPQNRGLLGRLGPALLFCFGVGVGLVSTSATLAHMTSGDGDPPFDPCNASMVPRNASEVWDKSWGAAAGEAPGASSTATPAAPHLF